MTSNPNRSTSMARHQSQAVALPGNPINALFETFHPEHHIVLAPKTHMAELPKGTKIVVTEVRVTNFDVKLGKEIYAIAGEDVGLGKVVLDRIAAAAGISWTAERRMDDGRHPHFYHMEVRGWVVDFDGTRRELLGSKALDLREDAGGGVPGKDYSEIVDKARAKKNDPTRQLTEARKFIAEIAASKARNRAIASCFGLKRAYTRAELERKAFVIPKLVADTNNPVAQEMILAGLTGMSQALYGNRPRQVVDAKFEESAPGAPYPSQVSPAGDGADEGEGTPSSSAPDSAPYDPQTGEVEDDMPPPVAAAPAQPPPLSPEKRIAAAWKKGQAAGIRQAGWSEIVTGAVGGVKAYDKMTGAELDAIDRAVEAFIARKKA